MNKASFLERIDTSGEGCHPFVGARDKNGYGIVRWNGRSRTAHAVAWEVATGQEIPPRKDPDHFEIDHVAANGCVDHACCRIDHLEPVTKTENRRRRMREVCPHGHALTPENIYWHPGGFRVCRACKEAQR